jgi:hypothetical protein
MKICIPCSHVGQMLFAGNKYLLLKRITVHIVMCGIYFHLKDYRALLFIKSEESLVLVSLMTGSHRWLMALYMYWGGYFFKTKSAKVFFFESTAIEGPVKIQYKCLVHIYVFPEMKLWSLLISKTEL